MDIIEHVEDIREIYGEPSERAVKKQLARLEKHSRAFIELSPFLVIASTDPSGRCGTGSRPASGSRPVQRWTTRWRWQSASVGSRRMSTIFRMSLPAPRWA